MRNIIAFLFKTCLMLFIVGGTCLVLGQLAGLLFQKGDWIIKSWELFANPTFIISAIAGIFGFILGYFPKEKANEETVYSSDEVSEELELVR
ncbi:hypothetical protein [Ureibacillus sp. GCM10028918]|uniref:hypothetical protein n=1 Tax=Ureibacillus sp. GCM10028918 TaxID=3273429 RepID=UPI0036161A3F